MATNTLDKQADLAARAAAWQHSRDPMAMLQSAGQALAEGRISVLDPRRLRLLAVWSAVFVNTRSWPAIEAAKAFLRFETQPGALARARNAAFGDAADARSMGLPQFVLAGSDTGVGAEQTMEQLRLLGCGESSKHQRAACSLLALLLVDGVGVPKNEGEARGWAMRAGADASARVKQIAAGVSSTPGGTRRPPDAGLTCLAFCGPRQT